MSGFKIYKSYAFTEKDPIIDRMRTLIQDQGLGYEFISAGSDVSRNTLRAWFDGKTRRPQYATVAAVLAVLGYELVTRKRIADVVPIHAAKARRAGK